MPLVAGDQIVGASRVGTFQEFIVVGIFRHLQRAGNSDGMRAIPDEVKKLPPESLTDSQLRARQYRAIFCENSVRGVQPGWRRDPEQQDYTREPVRLQGPRDKDVSTLLSRRR
jgi:hypothetical protein